MAIIVKGGGGKPEEEKTVTALLEQLIVTPESGKTLKKVTINPPVIPKALKVTTKPNKTNYSAGETLSLTGLVVSVEMSDGSTKDVTSECSFTPASGTVIYENTDSVSVSWISGDITYSTSFAVTVKRTLSAISITNMPNKVEYVKGESLDLTGIVITATYNSGATEVATDSCTFSPAEGSIISTVGSSNVTASYSENGITKSTSFGIIATAPIYGVFWDGTSPTVFSRTDAAELFVDPNPYYSGASSYGSPFDDIYPWSEMNVVDDATAGKLVSIPKFYYKWTKTGNAMKLQVSEAMFDGALVSPAHADRGDSKGERDIVYVGRYHCNSSYKSVTGNSPLASKTRAQFRSGIHALGDTYWQYDFAMYWTICMLYLVEFGDWNSQYKIGRGCSTSGSKMTMGYTDSMPYHTGTTASSRNSYGGTQYRNIEGLWDNVFDWCDGIYFSGSNVYCIKNPANFSDNSGGTNVGTRPTSSGYIMSWMIPTASGFEYALYPATVGGSDVSYISDYCYYSSSGVVLFVGGGYGQNLSYGLFCLNGGNSVSDTNGNIGSRLQKLP